MPMIKLVRADVNEVPFSVPAGQESISRPKEGQLCEG
jgi:hypothetical protein